MSGQLFRVPDSAEYKAARITGLARVGIAATDSVLNINLDASGYRETLETIAIMADDLFHDLSARSYAASVNAAIERDSPSKLFAEWQALDREWRAASKAMPADQDEPKPVIDLGNRVEAQSKRIAQSKPTTTADCAALLEWVLEDSDGALLSPMYAVAQRNVIAFLRKERGTNDA
ncbi:hypothetical protein [Blastomonas sp.]|uniref:hypothetical protein n=1 Tax=Blastomonas sp. TaxID=1909299 RepID=UPI003592F6F2